MTEGDLRLNARISALEWLINRLVNKYDISEEISAAISATYPEGSVAEMTKHHIQRVAHGEFSFPDYRPDEPP